jgi:hypothetical protein
MFINVVIFGICMHAIYPVILEEERMISLDCINSDVDFRLAFLFSNRHFLRPRTRHCAPGSRLRSVRIWTAEGWSQDKGHGDNKPLAFCSEAASRESPPQDFQTLNTAVRPEIASDPFDSGQQSVGSG